MPVLRMGNIQDGKINWHDLQYTSYPIRIKTPNELDAEYLNLCLNSLYAKDFCNREKTDGVSQSKINAQKLGKFELPYCYIEEQHEIVRRVEALFKIADQIQSRY
jgi:type I restriction enzyme, S subunit